jgi:hypothetical protein
MKTLINKGSLADFVRAGHCLVFNMLSDNRPSLIYVGSRKGWPKSRHHGRRTTKSVKYRIIVRGKL